MPGDRCRECNGIGQVVVAGARISCGACLGTGSIMPKMPGWSCVVEPPQARIVVGPIHVRADDPDRLSPALTAAMGGRPETLANELERLQNETLDRARQMDANALLGALLDAERMRLQAIRDAQPPIEPELPITDRGVLRASKVRDAFWAACWLRMRASGVA